MRDLNNSFPLTRVAPKLRNRCTVCVCVTSFKGKVAASNFWSICTNGLLTIKMILTIAVVPSQFTA